MHNTKLFCTVCAKKLKNVNNQIEQNFDAAKSTEAKYVFLCSLGPVVNILAIFSNANILKKNKRIKI